MTDACDMKATTRIVTQQVGHASGATSKSCCRSNAHRRRVSPSPACRRGGSHTSVLLQLKCDSTRSKPWSNRGCHESLERSGPALTPSLHARAKGHDPASSTG